MRTRRDAIPQRRTQGPPCCPPLSPETGTKVSEKGSLCAGKKASPPAPDCLGNEAALWPEHDPGLMRRAPQGAERCHSTRAAASHKDTRRGHQEDSSYWRQRPRKEELQHVWGQEGAGSQSQERNSSPSDGHARGPVSEFGPFTSGHPLLWNFHTLSPGLAVGPWGMLGQAAGHRVLVRLVSLTRPTCRPAPHLKRVWSAGSFR